MSDTSICECCEWARWHTTRGHCAMFPGAVPACWDIRHNPIIKGEGGIQECNAFAVGPREKMLAGGCRVVECIDCPHFEVCGDNHV